MSNQIMVLTILAAAGIAGASSASYFNTTTTDTTLKVENNLVYGNGTAVSGKTGTPNGVGVTGASTGPGVTIGVRGTSKTSQGHGVYGTNDAGGRGVYGLSTVGGYGVVGEAQGAAGIGVDGRANGVNGYYGVRGTGTSIGVYGTNNTPGGEGVRGRSIDSVGVMALSNTGTALRASSNYGVGAYASSASTIGLIAEGGTYGVLGKVGTGGSFGLYGMADLGFGVNGESNRAYGVRGMGPGGVLGQAYYNGNDYATGVLAYANGGPVTYAVHAIAEEGYYENWAGYFEGNVAITGECSPCVISDVSTKKNIQPLKGSLDKVLAMKPKSYEMKNAEFAGRIALAQGAQNGLIAQELETIVPEAVHRVTAPPQLSDDERRKGVKKDATVLKAVNYSALIPILIAAIQEQQAEIEALKAGR